MKQIENYIWNSFLNSGKKHLVLTGSHRVGKTTRFQSFCEHLKGQGGSLPGITTYVVPGESVMLRDNDTKAETVIGRFDVDLQTMKPISGGFYALGCPALKQMTESEGEWITIDELGFLESNETSFQDAVRSAFDRKRVLAVLRKQSTLFLDELKNRADVYLVDLDGFQKKVGCVIMASGLSSRFGENKLFAELNGKFFLERVLDLTDGIFARRVVVTRSTEAAEYCRKKNVDVILHECPYRSDTVRLGTTYMEDMDAAVFCPCDQPLLRRESLLKLRNAFSYEDKGLLRLACGEKIAMPALFGKEYFRELKNLPEGKGGAYVLKRHETQTEYIFVSDPSELFDVDTKEDLEELKKGTIFSDEK